MASDHKDYCGSGFSWGDKYIQARADRNNNKPGNPETWKKAAINHHLSFVVNQLEHLE